VTLIEMPRAALPASARHAARRTIANVLGLAVGACRHPAYEVAHRLMAEAELPHQATLLGRGEQTSMAVAAFLGGLAAHVEDFDDTHLRTVIHPGAPIVPAALAMAEHRDATYGELVDAVTVGVEVALRVGNGMCPGHFDRGWHVTSTTGRLGAAAAVGRMLRLTREQLIVALGIAATEAAGLQEALGTMTKSLHPGKAAADGVEAALLASYGFTGPPAPIEGRRGLARTATLSPDFAAMLADLGEVWEIENNTFKPYACGIVSHPVIDAAVALRSEIGIEDITKVNLRTNPVVLDVMGVTEPVDGLQSKFSVYHCFAIGILEGAGGPQQFSDGLARREDVAALRRRVSVEIDPSIAKDECFATVTVCEGRTLNCHVEHATASAAAPMTDEQLSAKVVLTATPVLGAERAAAVADAALTSPDTVRARVLVDLSIPTSPTSDESEA
jgi:2-methylcitrate dehydratase PrpD